MSTISDLVPLLIEKTQKKKLMWQITSESEVFAIIGENYIELDRPVGDTFDSYMRIAIRNKEGKVIDLESYPEIDYPGSELYATFLIAKRNAMKVDETIDEIKSNLQKL